MSDEEIKSRWMELYNDGWFSDDNGNSIDPSDVSISEMLGDLEAMGQDENED